MKGDGFKNLGLGFFAEAWQARDPVIRAGGLEIGDRADAERLMQGFDFFRAESLKVEELG